MAFLQTIAFSTSRIDEMVALSKRFREEHGSAAPGFRGTKILRDRERANSYMVIAEFDSYELAMENSNRPETDAFAKEMSELSDGPPVFGNYDVVHEETP